MVHLAQGGVEHERRECRFREDVAEAEAYDLSERRDTAEHSEEVKYTVDYENRVQNRDVAVLLAWLLPHDQERLVHRENSRREGDEDPEGLRKQRRGKKRAERGDDVGVRENGDPSESLPWAAAERT